MKHSHSCHSMPSVQQQTDINKPDPGLEPGTNNQSAEINNPSEKSEKSEKSSPSPINISEKSLNEIQTPSPPSSENTGKSGSGWARSGSGKSESGSDPERRDSETKIVVASTCSLNNDQEALSKQLELAKLQSRDLCIKNQKNKPEQAIELHINPK